MRKFNYEYTESDWELEHCNWFARTSFSRLDPWVLMLYRLLIVALLAQSLVMFTAKNSLINATTRTWPLGVEVWATIVVLTFNVLIMVFAFGNQCFRGAVLMWVVMVAGTVI